MSDSLHNLVLQFNNRFSMWMWVKWLSFLFDVWHGDVDNLVFPLWAVNQQFSSQVAVSIHNIIIFSGKGVISIDSPFTIKCAESSASILSMQSLIISLDSIEPKGLVLDIEIIYSDESIATSPIKSDIGRNHSTSAANVFSGVRKSVTGSVFNVINIAQGVKDAGVGAAASVASTTLNAARTISHGPSQGINKI
jgi:hypothetical protein